LTGIDLSVCCFAGVSIIAGRQSSLPGGTSEFANVISLIFALIVHDFGVPWKERNRIQEGAVQQIKGREEQDIYRNHASAGAKV
jgi:hypothetical protein